MTWNHPPVIPALFLASVYVPMAVEAIIAESHDRTLRALGAVEPSSDVFGAMQLAYPAAFFAMFVELLVRQVRADAVFFSGVVMFGAAKLLKYWAITTLGSRWTFRVLVPPNSSRIIAGPYRLTRHPNYVAVVGELVGAAVMAHSLVAGPLATIGFATLIRRRIVVEERALAQQPPT